MREQIRVMALFALLAVFLSTASPALADGIIIIDPPPIPPFPEPIWLTIRYHRVNVTIEDQVAITRVDQVFVNEHDWEAEGTYVFPLPPGATVSEFVMWVDNEPVEAEILEADEARAIYEDIVRNRRDPALLEYVGRDVVRARIFPIPAGGERRIQLEYTQVLPVEEGVVRYLYPLDTERFSARALEECSIRVEISSREPIRAVYSPTHQDRVFVERDGEYRAVVGYEESNVLPDENFDLVYTVSPEDVGLNLLTYRDAPDDGFFLLLVAPRVEVDESRVVPKDVILVLDTSGSMSGEKMDQAREALTYVLEHLNSEDRFNIVGFSTGLRQYAYELRPFSEVDEAVDWVQQLEAVGGTDINRALLEALGQVDRERPTVLVFLTDGQPTEGVTEIEQILANVAATATDNVRLFPFGVGDDVNTVLLDTLAQNHRGASGYVRPYEQIDEEVSAFYAKVSVPVLTDIELDFDDVVVTDTYPDPLPDLFAGTQLILAGRYRGDGPVRITLSGEVEGKRQELVYEGTFRRDGGDGFICRLWAARKIGYLLTQIRLYGERDEWIDAVIDLSVRYGIITPYTSFLIQEDLWTEGGLDDAADEFRALEAPAAEGAPAVEMAEEQSILRGAEAFGDGMLPEEAGQVVRYVGTKAFFLRDGVWTDSTYDAEAMSPVQVGFGTDAYFDMLAAWPEWGEYLALGSRVLFVAEGMTYEVVEGDAGPVEIPPTPVPGETADPMPVDFPDDVPDEPVPGPDPGWSVCPVAPVLGLFVLVAVAVSQRMWR